MYRPFVPVCLAIVLLCLFAGSAQAELCESFGPQAPRDITDAQGDNPVTFSKAPEADQMALCNMHFHRNAEHSGPEFSVLAGDGENAGFRCNQFVSAGASGEPEANYCEGVEAGDTIEMHWVYSSCDVEPSPGLGSCASPACANPQLRVEAQVFLVTANGGEDFAEYAEAAPASAQAVSYLGSTTGTNFSAETCSPLQVTWRVRPECRMLDIASLGAWCSDNPFDESKAHGVRELVTALELLSEIE